MFLCTLRNAFLFSIVSVHLSFAVTHTLQYVYTAVTPGLNFPEFTDVGLVDGEPFVYYDSNIRKYIPKTEWIQKISIDDPDYWISGTQSLQDAQEIYKKDLATLKQRFNQTKDVNTLQRMYGCELDDDRTIRGYEQFGYDGEDFISLDLESVTWTAAKPQALITKRSLDGTEKGPFEKFYLENICIEWLMKYVSYGRETLERKARPEVTIIQKQSSPEVVCHVTGFLPKSVNITWQKDGEDVLKDVELREMLPNQDGSFQQRSILKVLAEELQKHNYTCVVQHSSLEKEMVRQVYQSQVLRGRGTGGVLVVTGICSAVALVGILLWKKKKKSEFKPVAQNGTHSSEEVSHNKNSDCLPN